MTLLTPLGAAIAELLADAAVVAITTRVRPIEPAAGDALGPSSYLPFVVVSVLDSPARSRMPIRDVQLGLRCYAATFPAAEALWNTCEAVFLNRGARAAASGLGVWFSRPRSVGPDSDPDTRQPVWHGIVDYPTTIASVT